MSTLAPTRTPPALGEAVLRREDLRLLTGRGRFLADLSPLPNVAEAAILRSPHPHARIRAVDASRALTHPGVKAVLTGEEVYALMDPFPVVGDHPGRYYPIAVGRVRYVGEPVAVVVARDRYVAEDALAEVRVDYEPLPPVVDPERAAQADSPLLDEEAGTNVALDRRYRFGDVEQAFAAAEVVVEERATFNRFTAMPLEPYGVIGWWDPLAEAATAWCTFQGPFSMHAVLASALRLPPNRLRLIVPEDVGGGFGIKISSYPYIALILLASRKAGVPVRWLEDRLENLAASSSGTNRVSRLTLAARRSGEILAMRLDVLDDVGAYLRAPEPGTLFRPFGNYTGGYRIPAVELRLRAVRTDKVPTGPNRGYSCGQLYHALELAVDRLAAALGRDPADLRRQNLIPPEAMPYRTPTGGYYDAGDFPAVLDRLLEAADYPGMLRERAAGRAAGRILGVGCAVAVDPSASNMGYMSAANPPEVRAKEAPKSGTAEAATVAIDYGGRISVVLNTAPQGQGHETVAAQIAAAAFGVPMEEVSVTTGADTAERAFTIASGAYSSRFAATAAPAIWLAAEKLKGKLLTLAGKLLAVPVEDLTFEAGAVRAPDGRSVSLRRLAGTLHWNASGLPAGEEPGLAATAFFSIPTATFPDAEGRVNSSGVYSFAADLAFVEIDRRTADVRILRYVTAHDIGPLLNPLVVEGQIVGGLMHGVAGALYEELRYDEDGQLLTQSLVDYGCPTASEAVRPEIVHLATPSPLTPLGARGVGEALCQTAPAALANAVNDALAPLGVRITDLPITPERILATLAEAGRSL